MGRFRQHAPLVARAAPVSSRVARSGGQVEAEGVRAGDVGVVWPAWVQRCGIGSSCECPPHDQLAGVQRDLQRATAGGGAALPAGTRAAMEHVFAADFSAVRVHTGPASDRVASGLGARALTAGRDIVFGAGAFRPHTTGGDRLLAHELAHVVQQAGGLPRAAVDGGTADPLEKAAEVAADQAVTSGRVAGLGRHGVPAGSDLSPVSPGPGGSLAYELSHVVQRSSRASAIQRAPGNADAGRPVVRGPWPSSASFAPAAGVLQPLPQSWGSAAWPRSGSAVLPGTAVSADTELYFGTITDVCESCHQESEKHFFQFHKGKHPQVTESSILPWAASDAWAGAFSGKSLSRKQLFSMLLRREDKKLDAIWNRYREPTVGKIRPSLDENIQRPVFIGSYDAREHWARYVDTTWPAVVAYLDQWALDWLVRDIDEILHTRLIPAGATLVTDPARVAAIEDTPGAEKINLGRWGDTATRGFEWDNKRIKSAEPELAFEVQGHEGIYFEMSTFDFQKTDPFIGKLAGDVAAATEGSAVLGKFIKGLLTAVASPATMAVDTIWNVIDAGTLGTAAFGKWTGWYNIGYTCIGPICRQYEACIKGEETSEHCRSEILQSAIEEATVIVPLYRQGRECLTGDPEACGSIAALALGLVEIGGTPLEGAEFESAAIRGAIERPRAGDPNITSLAETLKLREKPGQQGKAPVKGGHEPAAGPRAHQEAPTGRVREHAAKTAPGEAVEGFAHANEISPKQLKADLAELRKDAKDPGKVHRPADQRFDAEISTSSNGERHRFDREKPAAGHEGEPGSWCRFSPPPGACGLRVDPEVDKMVDEAIEKITSETAEKPALGKEKKLKADEAKKIKAAAKEEFKYGPKHISEEVSRHEDAPAIREAEGVSGREFQSAHVAPSSFMKSLDDYLRDKAITIPDLERGKHFSFDQFWKDWAQDQRRLGRKEVTVQELHGIMAEAIERAPITDGQKSALFTLLHDELFQKHGLSTTAKLQLPYSNIPALKPGPELTALKTKAAAAEKARRAAEKAQIQRKISEYEQVAKSLEKSGNKHAQVYRLEIEKLKAQLKK